MRALLSKVAGGGVLMCPVHVQCTSQHPIELEGENCVSYIFRGGDIKPIEVWFYRIVPNNFAKLKLSVLIFILGNQWVTILLMLFMSFTVGLYKRISLKKIRQVRLFIYIILFIKREGAVFSPLSWEWCSAGISWEN